MPLLLLLLLYATGAFRRGHFASLRWRHTSFACGWLSLFFALASPLHELGEQLFSAHMLQHEVLILISAPLISASQPSATCLWAFAASGRSEVGRRMHSLERLAWIRLLSGPLAAWLLEAAALWLWHIPVLYQATLNSDWAHAAQHLCFLLTAVLFWSALYGVGRSTMGYGRAICYVFGTAAHCSALGALLTFSTVLWYPAYLHTTTAWGLTPLQDQQLGGVLMWVPSGFVFIAIGLALLARWLQEAEYRSRLGILNSVLRK
ncbi:MAG: cytochrome c oxidase assembly protein [Terriglobus sp.]